LTPNSHLKKDKGVYPIHELAVTEGVLKVVLKYAEVNEAQRVISIQLQVGELRDITEEWVQRYFDYLSRGTLAEGGKIFIKQIPAALQCLECEEIFEANIRQENILCPGCNSAKNKLIAGSEFLIESIEVI
jgi:hydrogenase nickel incorporation protein HypA/HybF